MLPRSRLQLVDALLLGSDLAVSHSVVVSEQLLHMILLLQLLLLLLDVVLQGGLLRRSLALYPQNIG